MLAVRLFLAVRATMAVLSTGYEVEGHAMVRLVIETTRARLQRSSPQVERRGPASSKASQRPRSTRVAPSWSRRQRGAC